MGIQCMVGAFACVGAASGTRAWLATRRWPSLTPQRMRRATIALIGAAMLASSLGSAASQRQPSTQAPPAPSASSEAVSR